MGSTISRGWRACRKVSSAKKAGRVSGRVQKSAPGFGARNRTTNNAATTFVDVRVDALLNQIAAIGEITSAAYIENLAAMAFEITGRFATSAHGIGNNGRPPTRSTGPNEATTATASVAIRNFPSAVCHALRR